MTAAELAPELALWGGFECSFTRIGDACRDQLTETGHFRRGRDVAEAARLGIRVLRWAFHWERMAASPAAWDVARAEIAELRRRGVGIVAGLMHHGSGLPGCDLLHPAFPRSLARHAAHVARLCPDAVAWTPVNEPLSTARLSCLYGHWHPHLTDTGAFLRAVVQQCMATLLAMRAIRRVARDALLLQTEDVTRVFATAAVSAQARYENLRRWLSLDLLCGRVGPAHPFHAALRAAGVPAAQLAALATGEATPDLIGMNYYVTSERFLDHRTALHPPSVRGGNGRMTYADIEAVRAGLGAGSLGWVPRLRELWRRYRIPIVISEAHLGCADEAEQARWFWEAWQAARTLRREGADIRAVTAWALAGAMDWDSLMRARRGSFECGMWQPGDGYAPRLIARLLPELAAGGAAAPAAIAAAGWWRREDRVLAQRARA